MWPSTGPVLQGSNSARSRVWKQLLELLCDQHGLTVTVYHYPTGCSKWNPIRHHPFGPISQTWTGHPLTNWETVLDYLRDTPPQTVLTVRVPRHDGVYQTGESIPNPS